MRLRHIPLAVFAEQTLPSSLAIPWAFGPIFIRRPACVLLAPLRIVSMSGFPCLDGAECSGRDRDSRADSARSARASSPQPTAYSRNERKRTQMDEIESTYSADRGDQSSSSLPVGEMYDRLSGFLPAERAGRFARLEITFIRELTQEDLLTAGEGQDVAGPTSLQSIKHSHHRLAMLVAQGKRDVEVSLITGYSPGYISRLQGDPAFKELLAYYLAQRAEVQVDALDRAKVLSLNAMDELQKRLEETPEAFTLDKLLAVAELGVVKAPIAARQSGAAGQASGPLVNVQVNFASSASGSVVPPPPTVDLEAKHIPREQEI